MCLKQQSARERSSGVCVRWPFVASVISGARRHIARGHCEVVARLMDIIYASSVGSVCGVWEVVNNGITSLSSRNGRDSSQ